MNTPPSPQEVVVPNTAASEDIPLQAPAVALAEDASPNIHIPVNARGIALAILATVAFVFALQWAQKFFIPLVFSILVSYTLNPVVVWLERIKIPRIVGTSLVLIALLCGAAVVANSLRTEFQSILVRL